MVGDCMTTVLMENGRMSAYLIYWVSIFNPDNKIDSDMAEVARYYKENEEGSGRSCVTSVMHRPKRS